MTQLKIKKSDVSIDSHGRVVIINNELKKRVEEFLKKPEALEAHDAGLFDNCDCKCQPE